MFASWMNYQTISNHMDIFQFLDYSDRGNLLDGFLHWFLLSFTILAIFGLIGLFIGWIMWRNCKKKCDAIERENKKLRRKESAA